MGWPRAGRTGSIFNWERPFRVGVGRGVGLDCDLGVVVPQDRFDRDPPAKPATGKSNDHVHGVVNMLYEQEESDAYRDEKGKPLVAFAGEYEIDQQHRRGMAGKEEVLGDVFRSIKEIAQGIDQPDQPHRRFKGNEGDRQKAGYGQQYIDPKKGQQYLWIQKGPVDGEAGKCPDQDKNGDGNVVRGEQP